MNDSTSNRQRRFRMREKLRAMAAFAHATEIDVAWFGVNRDGEHMAFGYDGKPISLNVRPGSPKMPGQLNPEDDPVDEVTARRASKSSESAPKPKKVYAPRSWDPARWNKAVAILQGQTFTKPNAREAITHTANLSEKQIKHAHAVIDALPDVPDWYASLPVAEES